jgi:hypothetical protein
MYILVRTLSRIKKMIRRSLTENLRKASNMLREGTVDDENSSTKVH